MNIKKVYVNTARSARGIADRLGLLRILENSSSRSTIWFRSLFSIYDSRDLIHLDLPWWTFKAIDAASYRLSLMGGKARVFEFGAGASTIWLSRRCREVTTVEHDIPFAVSMERLFSEHENISLLKCPPVRVGCAQVGARSLRTGYENSLFDDYVFSIDTQQGEFDLIVIDGRARVSCLEKAKARLTSRGFILFDNSNRSEYRGAIETSGMNEQVFRGLAPSLPFPSQTSILTWRK